MLGAPRIDPDAPLSVQLDCGLVYARGFSGALQHGDPGGERLRDLDGMIAVCERVLASRPPFHSPKAATYEAIAAECLKYARESLAEKDWSQAWRIFDMIHNFGMLLEERNDWEDERFLTGFVRPYLKESPEKYCARLRPHFGRLILGRA